MFIRLIVLVVYHLILEESGGERGIRTNHNIILFTYKINRLKYFFDNMGIFLGISVYSIANIFGGLL